MYQKSKTYFWWVGGGGGVFEKKVSVMVSFAGLVVAYTYIYIYIRYFHTWICTQTYKRFCFITYTERVSYPNSLLNSPFTRPAYIISATVTTFLTYVAEIHQKTSPLYLHPSIMFLELVNFLLRSVIVYFDWVTKP